MQAKVEQVGRPFRRSLKTKIILLVITILVCVELAVLVWSVATYRYERLERQMAQDMLVADAISIMRPGPWAATGPRCRIFCDAPRAAA